MAEKLDTAEKLKLAILNHKLGDGDWSRISEVIDKLYFERNTLEETLKKHLTVAEKYMATPLPPGAAHASDCPCGACP